MTERSSVSSGLEEGVEQRLYIVGVVVPAPIVILAVPFSDTLFI